uniref:Cation channel sperm-associated protein subunit gamma n=1 Tax=Castor canadensis TaxID=51338 RepID=A0A8C0ZXY6_CASCN
MCSRLATMSTASPVWPTARVLRAPWVLLLVVLAPQRLVGDGDFYHCTWKVVLNRFHSVGLTNSTDRFLDQEPQDTVDGVFNMLVDSPVDPKEKYMGFPYYLKVNYTCDGQPSEDLVRQGHLMGMKPLVLVTFNPPVNFYRWKMEVLQIQMEAAPFRNKGEPQAEVCGMSWYTPMPIKNGSVVMRVEVSTNGLGPYIPPKSFYMNINGFLKRDWAQIARFTVGDELFKLESRYFENVSSRALRFTVDHSPVLILGGIPDEKIILMTDTNFEDFSIVELSIDSCWVGSHYCPQSGYSATILDVISTESTLFIRQNQLVYYFTGTYSTLYDKKAGSSGWVRVLASECIKKLCPVYFNSNGSEYLIALTMNKHEGYLYLGTIRGKTLSPQVLLPHHVPRSGNCTIIWSVYISADFILQILVEKELRLIGDSILFPLIVKEEMKVLYDLPEYIPDTHGLEFLMIVGTETFTTIPMTPKGMFFNNYNNQLFLWGNFLMQSYNEENFIYLSDFPHDSVIKYMVNSFQGDVVIVTESEDVWYLQEGSYRVYRLIPSTGWDIHRSLQMMLHSSFYANRETMITVFYEHGELFQLVYLKDDSTQRIVKRIVPGSLGEVICCPPLLLPRGYPRLTFADPCPFMVMRLRDLPNPQAYTREERYRARPPFVMDQSGFHNENSLAVYQGLVYYLLWLHSKYDKPYADPVHDPTWRWWKNKKHDQDYYFYLASNWRSTGGVHIDMESYEKIYDLKSKYTLPTRIFLDKGTMYNFTIFLTATGTSFYMPDELGLCTGQVKAKLALSVVVADPNCIEALVKQEVLVNRNSVQFMVRDKRACYGQGISGHSLMKTSMMIKVELASPAQDFSPAQGSLMVPVLIGCPLGKRLAFDITYTLEYNSQQNKHYFNCVNKDPEMPCFLFRDIFYPFFLIQDLVTGESGSFKGSYILKVVGGGSTLESIKDYTDDEIYRYNSPRDKTNSLIWNTKTKKATQDMEFHILSYESTGIEWLCLQNSPCHDTLPQNIFAPEFYFKVLVSNKGVDKSTYCDYKLIFLLHVHGLPLSGKRALYIIIVSFSIFLGLVSFYIIFCLVWPYVVNAWDNLRWKINNLMISESYYTYATSVGPYSMSSQVTFMEPIKELDNVPSKMVQDKAEPEPTSEKKPET